MEYAQCWREIVSNAREAEWNVKPAVSGNWDENNVTKYVPFLKIAENHSHFEI